ncbi:MAG: hypothetical protein RLZZ618_3836 [Pseudomonadota bacterium]|jgi:sigma-54-specific transcriptional regulator
MPVNDPVLTLPESPSLALSIRAKAMLFHDPISQALLQQVERVARSEATVVVIGETGTGKELIARHVHTASGRRGPFVAVNCGAFTESLIDAELFGHEAGAFTGAQGARAGWFETAHGGTLFLDEIGDLSLPLQVKLLRVLQERQVVRLGSRRPIPVDVRLVAATNIDLQKAVEAQHFRADLYYRLNVASVNLPPLRERPGDILPLAHHFAGVYAARMGQREVFIAPDAEAALLAYVWPGNIRELENVMHFALIVCRNGVVRTGDLKLVPVAMAPSALTSSAATAAVATPVAGVPRAETPVNIYGELTELFERLVAQGGPDVFQSVEETLVKSAFARCRDNQVQTARALGITRNSLRTLLKRYGLLDADSAESAAPVDLHIESDTDTQANEPVGSVTESACHLAH